MGRIQIILFLLVFVISHNDSIAAQYPATSSYKCDQSVFDPYHINYTNTSQAPFEFRVVGGWCTIFSFATNQQIAQVPAPVTYVCQSGDTLNGSTCTELICAQGFTKNAQGQCVRDCNGLKDRLTLAYWQSPSTSGCAGGCALLPQQMSNQYAIAGVQQVYGVASYTGQTCTENNATEGAMPQNASSCPKGQCPGEVNGKAVCLSCSSENPGISVTAKTTTNSDGTKSVTTTTTQHSGSAGVSTTTNTVNYSPSGTVISSSKTEDNQSDDCDTNPNSPACSTLGAPTDPSGPEPVERRFTLENRQYVSESGGCPSDKVISVGGTSYTLRMQPICQYASGYVRPYVLLAAGLVCIGIFVGAFKE